jgi:hypothetical protein
MASPPGRVFLHALIYFPEKVERLPFFRRNRLMVNGMVRVESLKRFVKVEKVIHRPTALPSGKCV